jgi:outer membrane protein assembly factor BamD (BamD/ComL family)
LLRRCSSFFALVFFLIAPTLAAFAAKDDPEPIVVNDPQYGEVLFYFYQEDYFPAIVRLQAAQQLNLLNDHIEQSDLLLGGMYLSYGHHLEAAEIFERLLADNVQPEVRDRTWFFLAKIWKQRGYLEKSEYALQQLGDNLPDNMLRESKMLHAQILIDSGRYGEAVAQLARWKGRTEWASYAQFNLGVALVRNGDMETASGILNELGSIDAHNEELAALRDKANLALGYSLLQEGRPAAAKEALQRIRLEGPFSNKALLGVGWADAELNNYQSALVPWMELRGRDLLDSAVQEAMLAIPYGLSQLESISQAADHYLNAVEAFYEETNRIDRTIEFIESGDMFDKFLEDGPTDSTGWYWQLNELPQGPESRYLYHLLAKHSFQEGLKNYRDLNYLHGNLDTWQESVSVYSAMLETRLQAYEERLPRVEETLTRTDIDDMIDRKLEYDVLLDNIERSNDWLALAQEQEFEMWSDIVDLENTPSLTANTPEADEFRDKINLLKGVLQWELEREFGGRLWKIRRDLRETGESLVETQRARRQIDETMRNEPVKFAEFSERVYGLSPRIDGMKLNVSDAMVAQGDLLRSIAVDELQAQKRRLDTYTLQARFALAAIYDQAAVAGDGLE